MFANPGGGTMKTLNRGLRANRRLMARGLAMIPMLALAVASAQAGTITTVASTIPSNGDLNPYGVARVPATKGSLTKGNILVSNFNNSNNLQGTGTTIVQISPSGAVTLFAQIDPNHLPGPCPGGVGLSTALVALRSGWVIVGSLPSTDGTSKTAKAGCLLVLDDSGKVVETFSGKQINGPWDMTASDGGDNAALFVTNVLNGTVAGGGKIVHKGTVLRIIIFASNMAPCPKSGDEPLSARISPSEPIPRHSSSDQPELVSAATIGVTTAKTRSCLSQTVLTTASLRSEIRCIAILPTEPA
jgi:hypothetical protein